MAENDPFEGAQKVSFATRPTMKMLTRGGVERVATYAKGEEGSEVTIKKCVGRTLLVIPKKIERQVKSRQFPDNAPTDRITADYVVLDGDPITEIVDKDGDTTAELEEPLVPPFLVPDAWINNTLLVRQLEGTLSRNGKLLGQLMLLPPVAAGGNKSYAFGDYSDEAREIAKKWIADHPEPDEFA